MAVNEAPSSFANLRIINAGVCPINAFGLGLNAEIPAMQVGIFWCICHFRNLYETRPALTSGTDFSGKKKGQ